MDKDVEAGPAFPPPDSETEEKKSVEKKPEEKKPEEKKPEKKKPGEKKPEGKPSVEKPKRSAEKTSSGTPVGPKPSGSTTRIKWKIKSFVDCNCWYLLRIRGIMNIIHLALSIALIFLLGNACQLHPAQNKPSEGFFCKPPEVFLFITSCAAFFNSLLYLICCLLSKRTDNMLFQTALEISYYILYFILFLAASITLLISIINWGTDRIFFNTTYATLQTIAIVGLVTGACYGISTLWFFVSHQFYTSEIIIEDNLVVDDQIVPAEDNE